MTLFFLVAGQGLYLWFFRSYFFLLFIGVLLLGAGVSVAFLLGQRNRNDFEVRPALPGNTVGKNRKIPVGIHVYDRMAYPGFPIEVDYELENAFTGGKETGKARAWAAPGRSLVLDRELCTRHYGMHRLKVTHVTLWDWFRLSSLSWEPDGRAHTLVAPVAAQNQEVQPREWIQDFPGESELGKRGMDLQPDTCVREYIPGDALRSIHWKLTAKKGTTMVRERMGPGRDVISLVLPLGADPEENDGLMEALLHLGSLLLEKGYPLRVCYADGRGELAASFLAEQGELERVLGEILSIYGKREPGLVQHLMEVHFPGEAYVVIRNGAYKGEYIRAEKG